MLVGILAYQRKSSLMVFKVRLSPSENIGFISFKRRPLMMKNASYFMLKLFSFSKYLNICPDFFGYVGKRLDKKYKNIFKICGVAYWEKIITIHTLSNI